MGTFWLRHLARRLGSDDGGLSGAGFNGVIPNLLWGGSAYYNSKFCRSRLLSSVTSQIEQAVAAGKSTESRFTRGWYVLTRRFVEGIS